MTKSYDQLVREYGEYTLDGVTVAATDQAERTNRVFPGWFGEAREGERYIDEFGAPAVSREGAEYWITWRHEQRKGSEPDDDLLDWSSVARIGER